MVLLHAAGVVVEQESRVVCDLFCFSLQPAMTTSGPLRDGREAMRLEDEVLSAVLAVHT